MLPDGCCMLGDWLLLLGYCCAKAVIASNMRVHKKIGALRFFIGLMFS
jgi:hypothetical protein